MKERAVYTAGSRGSLAALQGASLRSRRWKNLENVEAVDQFQELTATSEKERKRRRGRMCVCMYTRKLILAREPLCLLWFRSYRPKRFSLFLFLFPLFLRFFPIQCRQKRPLFLHTAGALHRCTAL